MQAFFVWSAVLMIILAALSKHWKERVFLIGVFCFLVYAHHDMYPSGLNPGGASKEGLPSKAGRFIYY